MDWLEDFAPLATFCLCGGFIGIAVGCMLVMA
jgi:hypothetical protein